MPQLGILQYSGQYAAAEKNGGVKVVEIGASWSLAEPAQNTFSATYANQLNAKITAAISQGFSVSLDLGTQFGPDWVFALPGGTHFVDQYGDIFDGTASSGNHVPNAITDPAVRTAMGDYLTWLGANIRNVSSIRIGGGAFNEMRYPDTTFNKQGNCWWAYDASSQANVALQYKPGTGTSAQAQAFVTTYNANLNAYGLWLYSRAISAFPAATGLVLLPGWGERPGREAAVVAGLLMTSQDPFNQGLDWVDFLKELPKSAVAYTTYGDSPTFNNNPDPADFIASIVATTGQRQGGENTGGTNEANMDLMFSRAASQHWVLANWAFEPYLVESQNGIGFAQLSAASIKFGLS